MLQAAAISERPALQAGVWCGRRATTRQVSPSQVKRLIGLAQSSKRSLSLSGTGAALGRKASWESRAAAMKARHTKMRRAFGFVNRAPQTGGFEYENGRQLFFCKFFDRHDTVYVFDGKRDFVPWFYSVEEKSIFRLKLGWTAGSS